MRLSFRTVLFFLLFVLPVAAVALYEWAYATDRYHSDATITITQGTSSAPSLDLSIIGLPAAADSKDTQILVTFITSIDMLQFLEDKLHLRRHYSDERIDWYSRLPAGASLEEFHEYLSSHMTVTPSADSHLISIHVEAFTRDFARDVVNAILERSQIFVDNLNARVTDEQSRFFENQLSISESRLKDAKNQLLTFQRENRLFSTDVEATMINTNIAALEKLLLDKQGELAIKLRDLNEASPVIQLLRAEIETVKKQLGGEKERLSGGSGGAVSELDARYREIQFNLEFVGNLYKSNMTQLEQARIEAIQRLKYLVVVTQPSLADASLYPNRPYVVGTAMIVCLMIYFIVSLLVAIVREHA